MRKDPTGFVYVAKCGNYYKIGFSEDPVSRMKGLQTANPEEVILVATIPGTMKAESRWHRIFAHKLVRGEWFNLDQEDLTIIFSTPKCVIHKSEESSATQRLTEPERWEMLKQAQARATKARKAARRQAREMRPRRVDPPPAATRKAPNGKPLVRRDQIRSLPCRKCGAGPGEWCIQGDVPRISNHVQRLQDAQAQIGNAKVKHWIA